MRLLITRPTGDAQATAATLAARGHEVLSCPLIVVAPTGEAKPSLTATQGFIVTDPDGARALADAVGVRIFPVFCDSPATAVELTRLGFSDVRDCNGDATAIARRIETELKPKLGGLVYVCSTSAAVNLAAMLGNMGFAVRMASLYAVKRADELPAPLVTALRDETLDAAIFFSADEARAFAHLVQCAELDHATQRLTAIVAAPVVAAPLTVLKFARVVTAPRADAASFTAFIDDSLLPQPEPVAPIFAPELEPEPPVVPTQTPEEALAAVFVAPEPEPESEPEPEAPREEDEPQPEIVFEPDQVPPPAPQADDAPTPETPEEPAQEAHDESVEETHDGNVPPLRESWLKKMSSLFTRAPSAPETPASQTVEAVIAPQDVPGHRDAIEEPPAPIAEPEATVVEPAAIEPKTIEPVAIEPIAIEPVAVSAPIVETPEPVIEDTPAPEAPPVVEAPTQEPPRPSLWARAKAAFARPEKHDDIPQPVPDADNPPPVPDLLREPAPEPATEEETAPPVLSPTPPALPTESIPAVADAEPTRTPVVEPTVVEFEPPPALSPEPPALRVDDIAPLSDPVPMDVPPEPLRPLPETIMAAPEPPEDVTPEPEPVRGVEPPALAAEDVPSITDLPPTIAPAESILPPPVPTSAPEEATPSFAPLQAADVPPLEEISAATPPAALPPSLQPTETKPTETQPAEEKNPTEESALGRMTPANTSPPPVEKKPSLAETLARIEEGIREENTRQTNGAAAVTPEATPEANMETNEAPRSRTGGRSARLLAEDAADARARNQRFKPETTPDPEAAPDAAMADTVTAARAARSGGRSFVPLFLLLVVAGAVLLWAVPQWRAGVRALMSPNATPVVATPAVPAAAPPAPTPTPAPAAISADIAALNARLSALEQKPASADANALATLTQRLDAVEAAVRAGTPEGSEALSTSVTNQARQLATVTARVATMEAAIGNVARLEDMATRLNALESSRADASSVLALGERIGSLEKRDAIAATALVLATAQLRDAALGGRSYAIELETVTRLAGRAGVAFDDAALKPAAAKGLPHLDALTAQFNAAAPAIVRANALPATANWLRRATDRVLSIISVRPFGAVTGDTPGAVVARAEQALRRDNLAQAVAELETLTGAPAEAAKPWITEAKARVAAQSALDDLAARGVGAMSAGPASP